MHNMKRLFPTIITAALLAFGFDFLLHNLLLKDLYISTASLWRSPEEMQKYCTLIMINHLVYAVIFTCLAVQYLPDFNWKEGVKFGIFVGLLLAIMQFSVYPYMPIPMLLSLAWALGALLQSILLGLTIGLIYKR